MKKLCDKCKYPCFQQCPAVNSDIEYGGEGTSENVIIQCDIFENANLNEEPRGVLPMDKNIEDFKQIAYNLRKEGHVSRADAVMYLVERVKIAEGRFPGLHGIEEMRKDIKDLILLHADAIKETKFYEEVKSPDLDELRQRYLTDPIFHSKVYSLVSPLLNIVNRYFR